MNGCSLFYVLTSQFVFMFGSGSVFMVWLFEVARSGTLNAEREPNVNTNREARTRKCERWLFHIVAVDVRFGAVRVDVTEIFVFDVLTSARSLVVAAVVLGFDSLTLGGLITIV